MSTIGKLYTEHHEKNRGTDFSIMKFERSRFFKENIGTGKTVLDIGCRNGALTRFFVDNNTVTGVDFDAKALQAAKDDLKIETIEMDLLTDWTALDGRTFDVVVAGEVLEHLYFPEKIVEKVAAHLNEGGMFVGSVPNAFSLKNRLRLLMGTKKGTSLMDPTHINHFTFAELEKLLSKYFKEVSVKGLGRYTKLSALSPKHFAFDLVFVCKK